MKLLKHVVAAVAALSILTSCSVMQGLVANAGSAGNSTGNAIATIYNIFKSTGGIDLSNITTLINLGKILTGATGAGGEIGHMHVEDAEEEACGCKNKGCLEQYASATGIARLANRRLAKDDTPSALRGGEVTAKTVFDAVKEGDALAIEVAEQFGEYLGKGLALVAAVVNPEIFVIGGGACAIISSFLAVLIMIRYPLAHMADDGWLPAGFRKKSAEGYPFVSYLLVYVVALIPILTGMNVDSAISMLMIPTMLINAYLNVACVTIPRKYPEQFARRAVRAPLWLFDLCSVLGGVCALIIAFTLFKDLTAKDAVVAVCVVVFPLIFSAIALRRGSVSAKTLAADRERIVAEALAEE